MCVTILLAFGNPNAADTSRAERLVPNAAGSSSAERLVVITKGPSGFGVICNSANLLVALKGRAATDAALRVGELVVSVDGEALADGERLVDRIKASPERDAFTLGVVNLAPSARPPSLNEIMRTMIKSPAIRKMATKMAVTMAKGERGSDSNLIAGVQQQALLDGGQSTSQPPPDQQRQLALAQQQEEQFEQLMEQQLGAVLDSPQFGDMMDRVLESPAIQKATPAELSACLMDGGLLRTVSDATCEAMGVGRAECEQVHAQASRTLDRLGMRGDGWLGWLMRQLLLRPWLTTALDMLCVGAAVLLLGLVGGSLAWRVRRWRRSAPSTQTSTPGERQAESHHTQAHQHED